jgi:hypothetical protein
VRPCAAMWSAEQPVPWLPTVTQSAISHARPGPPPRPLVRNCLVRKGCLARRHVTKGTVAVSEL